MKKIYQSEIDDNFYCSANKYDATHDTECCLTDRCKKIKCCNCHRKYPTIEQFLEEYGEKYTKERPVWLLIGFKEGGDWVISSLDEARKRISRIVTTQGFYHSVVCACTPFSKPDEDWRP